MPLLVHCRLSGRMVKRLRVPLKNCSGDRMLMSLRCQMSPVVPGHAASAILMLSAVTLPTTVASFG
jgi:hypothetical protein